MSRFKDKKTAPDRYRFRGTGAELLQSYLIGPAAGPAMNPPKPPSPQPAENADGPKVVRAEELFGERREVWIELDGVRYRLRITRRGKLILQK